MNTALTVIISLLVFGFLIFIHEFGHYITARIFRVTISEFSIGMGPKLMWYDSKKTGIKYSLAMFPIGGYVAMVGENEETDDPNSFDKKPAWQRFIITAAGATVNIIAGFLAMAILTAIVNIGSTTVHSHLTPEEIYGEDGDTSGYVSSLDSGLLAGDKIVSVGGKNVYLAEELSYEIMRQGNKPVEITVMRDGELVTLPSVVFPKTTESGAEFGLMDVRVYRQEKTFANFFGIALRKSFLVVRMCWESLFDLITGRYGVGAVSGPVGISGAIGDAAKQGFASLLNITAIISINLGVMNLLPIPALDGGRILTILIEMITRKKLPTKVEGWINGIGLVALLLLSVAIMIKDVIQLF